MARAQAGIPTGYELDPRLDVRNPEVRDALALLSVTTPERALRLKWLELGLSALASADGDRFLYGGATLGVGAALGAALYWMEEPQLRATLGMAAGVIAARGTVQLAMSTRAARNLPRFLAMPTRDAATVADKLTFGERALAHAAIVGRRRRIIEGTLTVIAAVAQVPLSWALARGADDRYRFGDTSYDYVGITVSVIGVASGLVRAIRKSEEEQLLRQYRALAP